MKNLKIKKLVLSLVCTAILGGGSFTRVNVKASELDTEIVSTFQEYNQLIEDLPVISMEVFNSSERLPENFVLYDEISKNASGTYSVYTAIGAPKYRYNQYLGIHPATHTWADVSAYYVGDDNRYSLTFNIGYGPFYVSVGSLGGNAIYEVEARKGRPSKVAVTPDLKIQRYKVETRYNANNQLISTRYEDVTRVDVIRYDAIYRY